MEKHVLLEILKKLAPGLSTQDFTNPNAGVTAEIVSKVGICVDPTVKNIENAIKSGVELLITYHPLYDELVFPVSVSVSASAQKRQLPIWSLHEAWDNTGEGVIYTFAKDIGITDLYSKGELVIGATNSGLRFRELIESCQRSLGQNILSYSGDLKQNVVKAAIWAGPGFLPNYRKFWELSLAECCDTVLSSELTLSALRYSRMHRLKFIDLGHSPLAKPGMLHLMELLKAQAPTCSFQFLDDLYACNYYTNCSFAEQFTEAEDIFFETEN
jgi:putative NIF3 family GTP cyclohydrolase 1 type 2